MPVLGLGCGIMSEPEPEGRPKRSRYLVARALKPPGPSVRNDSAALPKSVLIALLRLKGTRRLRQTEQPPRIRRRCNCYVFDAYAPCLGDLACSLDDIGGLVALATTDLRRAVRGVSFDDQRFK